jgi:hypothetical protein
VNDKYLLYCLVQGNVFRSSMVHVYGVFVYLHWEYLSKTSVPFTTENLKYECLEHSVKPSIHSSKALLSVTVGENALGKQRLSKSIFVQCFPLHSRSARVLYPILGEEF